MYRGYKNQQHQDQQQNRFSSIYEEWFPDEREYCVQKILHSSWISLQINVSKSVYKQASRSEVKYKLPNYIKLFFLQNIADNNDDNWL